MNQERQNQIMIIGMKEIINILGITIMKDIIKQILIIILYMAVGIDMIIAQALINIEVVA
jgi:hypothetical protein